jgi:hypothetical protein
MAAYIGDSAVNPTALGRVIVGYRPPTELCQPRTSASLAALVSQALPLAVVWPVMRISTWFLFALLIHAMQEGSSMRPRQGYYVIVFFFSIMITVIVRSIVSPLLGLAAKWVIMGRARPGAYPLWGSYYLRRMVTAQLMTVFGRGMFMWNSSLLTWYYRLAGAKIGRNVKLHTKAQLSDFDLITIGEGTTIDAAVVRIPSLSGII